MHEYKKVGFALFIGLGFFLLSATVFSSLQSTLVGLIAFLVVLWTNEGFSLAVVSLLPIVLFPAFNILSTKVTAANYAHPIIFLFFGGFLLAIAVEKTELHMHVADKILNLFPNTARGMIFSLALTSGALSSILSNTTTTLLLMPIALFISEDVKLKMRFALAIAYGASVGGIITPIGTPPNLILLGLMNEHHLEILPFFKWVVMVLPLSLMMLAVVSFILGFGVKNIQIHREKHNHILNKEQKKIMLVLMGLILILLVNAPIKPFWNGLGLSESALLLGTGLLLFMPPFHILEWNNDSTKIPFKIMFLFGAGFSIAKAFSVTGLADEVASYLLAITHLSPLLLLFAVAFLITFTTEVTSNTALISIMLPVIYSIAQQSGIDTTLFMMVATICASYAFMLPIATPPNAIAMSSGVVHVKSMIRYGFILNLVGIFLIVMVSEFFWKLML